MKRRLGLTHFFIVTKVTASPHNTFPSKSCDRHGSVYKKPDKIACLSAARWSDGVSKQAGQSAGQKNCGLVLSRPKGLVSNNLLDTPALKLNVIRTASRQPISEKHTELRVCYYV